MTEGLTRHYEPGHLHFITCSCYRRRPYFSTATTREAFLRSLHEVRERHGFLILGYVVMPEHVHLLVSNPATGTHSSVMQVLKQLVSRRLSSSWKASSEGFWTRRFYDFNVFSRKKRIEKLHYMHMNPVERGLVEAPHLWPWSSYRFYQYGEVGICTPDREPANDQINGKGAHPSKSGKDGAPGRP